jgi:hypothetical protein
MGALLMPGWEYSTKDNSDLQILKHSYVEEPWLILLNPSKSGIYFFVNNSAQNANLAPKLSDFSSHMAFNNYTRILYDLKFLVCFMKARFQNSDFPKNVCQFCLTSIHLQRILSCVKKIFTDHMIKKINQLYGKYETFFPNWESLCKVSCTTYLVSVICDNSLTY